MTHAEPSGPFRLVREVPTDDPPGFTHPGWRERHPWLVQGTTGRGPDLGLFSDASTPRAVMEHWQALGRATGMPRLVHAHQLHEARVRAHAGGPSGFFLADPCDGHATASSGVLLAVTTADCVPVSLVAPGPRAVALLHAGWRGAAAGILEHGLRVMADSFDAAPADVELHLGPAICGSCYEVGPEVFRALGLEAPDHPAPVDLRRTLAEWAVAAGVPAASVTVSAHCTLCGGGGPGGGDGAPRDDALPAGAFYSHRGGDRARQAGYLGIRP